MARKQSDYLADLLNGDEASAQASSSQAEAVASRPERHRGSTLLGRESALARVASGEVRQVTQLLLDPTRVRVWEGNARQYSSLNETNCSDLIDSILAEGGQKVPAVVRRIDDNPSFEYEVIAGTRRHWSINWLRRNNYPNFMFLAQVAQLDDEAAFRLADIENRARADVSEFERARNYASALVTHYGGHQTRMADRLKLSKGWLSKMLRIAAIPDAVVDAFASHSDVQLKQGYLLAQALDDKGDARAILAEAKRLSVEQKQRSAAGSPPLPGSDVFRRLLAAPRAGGSEEETFKVDSAFGRTLLSVQSANRQGVTLRLHAGAGADEQEILQSVKSALQHLDEIGKGLRR